MSNNAGGLGYPIGTRTYMMLAQGLWRILPCPPGINYRSGTGSICIKCVSPARALCIGESGLQIQV